MHGGLALIRCIVARPELNGKLSLLLSFNAVMLLRAESGRFNRSMCAYMSSCTCNMYM
jgi:hypothetical protein